MKEKKTLSNKTLFFLLFIILTLIITIHATHFVKAETQCFQGIDGVCDEACKTVDFDCIDNPNQEGLLNDKILLENEQQPSATAIIQPKSNSPVISESSDQQTDVEIVRPENPRVPGEEIEIYQKKPLSKQILLFGSIGIVLLIAMLFFVIKRIEESERQWAKSQEQLTSFIKELQHNNYSDEKIKELFRKRGYTEKIIQKLFKIIEREKHLLA